MFSINRSLFENDADKKDLKKFEEVLNKCRISYEVVDENSQPVIVSNINAPDKITKTTWKMFENNKMKICLVRTPNFPPYFLVTPENQAKTDSTLFLFEIQRFIHFLKAKGYAQNSFYQNQDDKSIKIIPLLDAGIEVDINQKIINLILCFFGEAALRYFDVFPTPNLEKTSLTDKRFQSLHFIEKTIWKNARDLGYNVSNTIFSYLSNKNALRGVSKENLKTLKKEMDFLPKEMEKRVASCAFCRETVIRNQLVLDFGKLLLLFSFRPWGGTKAHFLILPSRHIEDWSDLREDENAVLTTVVGSLAQSIQVNCEVKKTDVISYVQNGMQAGQTVPHSHMHVLTKPNYIPYLIDIYYQMVGMESPALNAKEIAELSEPFKPMLFQSLVLKAPPPKLLRFDQDIALTMFEMHKKRLQNSYETKTSSTHLRINNGI